MTGQIHKRNEKILNNLDFNNFDFIELSEIYIHSGELTLKEIKFLRERISELEAVRDVCDSNAYWRIREINEEKIAKFLGINRYKRLKSEMELHLKEYCDIFLESPKPIFYSLASPWQLTLKKTRELFRSWIGK